MGCTASCGRSCGARCRPLARDTFPRPGPRAPSLASSRAATPANAAAREPKASSLSTAPPPFLQPPASACAGITGGAEEGPTSIANAPNANDEVIDVGAPLEKPTVKSIGPLPRLCECGTVNTDTRDIQEISDTWCAGGGAGGNKYGLSNMGAYRADHDCRFRFQPPFSVRTWTLQAV